MSGDLSIYIYTDVVHTCPVSETADQWDWRAGGLFYPHSISIKHANVMLAEGGQKGGRRETCPDTHVHI